MASNTGKTPSASSSKSSAAKKPAAKQTKEASTPSMMTCGHCLLEYQVHVPGQDPDTKYQAMETFSKMRNLQVAFYSGQITVSQKKEGNWCERTFLRKDYTWENFEVPEKQDITNRFLHINVHLRAGSPAPTPTFKTTKPNANAQETALGIEQAKGFPLANLPPNVFRLRLLLAGARQFWILSKGANVELKLEIRGCQIQRLLTGAVSVDPTTRVARELGTDRALMKLESTKDEEQLGSLEAFEIEACQEPGKGDKRRGNKPAYDFDKIDERPSVPALASTPATTPMPEAGLALEDPIALIGPSTLTRRDDIAGGAMEQLKAFARQQGLVQQDEGLEATIGLPAEQPRREEFEVEGKGSGKSSVLEQWVDLKLQLDRLEKTRKERQRQLWDRFNAETSKVDQEHCQQTADLWQQFLERMR